jgi:hypothetical protein
VFSFRFPDETTAFNWLADLKAEAEFSANLEDECTWIRIWLFWLLNLVIESNSPIIVITMMSMNSVCRVQQDKKNQQKAP